MPSGGGASLPRPEIAVVGAGPGGTMAALALKRARPDAKVKLIERLDDAKFPRYHRMCGEGISRAGLDIIDIDYEPFVVGRITRAVEHWPGGMDVGTSVDGLIIDRPGLLKAMREEFASLGGEVVIGSLEVLDTSGPKVRMRLADGRFVVVDKLVGADGARSIVRDKVFGESVELIWTEQYVLDREPLAETIEFFYDAKYGGGYRWSFPNGGTTRVGFPKGLDEPPEGPVIDVHRRAIPLGPVRRLVSGNVCIVGDAAGQVNPITFGGIRMALTAGWMAADALAKDDIGSYQAKWFTSPYADPIFRRGYDMLKGMDNEELQVAMRPFRKGFSKARALAAVVKAPKYLPLYRSFERSMMYGW